MRTLKIASLLGLAVLAVSCARPEPPPSSAEQNNPPLRPAARVEHTQAAFADTSNAHADRQQSSSASESSGTSSVRHLSDDSSSLSNQTEARQGARDEESNETRTPDVVYVPTPQPIVDKMLAMAKVTKKDIVYDLGCGDGRIVVTAAKRYGAKAYGFDIDPQRVKEALENVKKNKVENLVTIEQKDIFTLDLSPASVVTLYLLPQLNVKLIPQLQQLKPGSRVVSHDFDMAGVEPLQQVTMRPAGTERDHYIYLWHAPIQKKNSASAAATSSAP